jgi:hypothetical protein
MNQDAIRLCAHYSALNHASDTYARAGQAMTGSAYGVELRTLARARLGLAERFSARLRDMGAPAPAALGQGYVNVAALLTDPREGVAAVLEGERMLIADLEESSRHHGLSPESRRLVLSTLPPMRAHAWRVERFLNTL